MSETLAINFEQQDDAIRPDQNMRNYISEQLCDAAGGVPLVPHYIEPDYRNRPRMTDVIEHTAALCAFDKKMRAYERPQSLSKQKYSRYRLKFIATCAHIEIF